jgi:hypothetical protein
MWILLFGPKQINSAKQIDSSLFRGTRTNELDYFFRMN